MSLFQGEFPPLRDFQVSAHEALRKGAREGHRLQLIMAPTGAGKTILGMNVIKRSLEKGRKAMFVCDRKTLIAQASKVAEEVGMGNHGIIQAQNQMMNLSHRFQIASLQTLKSRGWPDGMDVIVVDEAHTQYKTWVDYVTSEECKALVVGLSATPFSPGLGRVFSNLINAATMNDLTAQGILVPMRVYTCRRPDMTGAETSGGEWTSKAAEDRELSLVGDVVTEWTRLARGRKTLCFGATIRHCEEIAFQFNKAGIPATTFCSSTPDDERARILQAFSLGQVSVLVSVEALAKGFDVKNVGCVCDCRPLRKSLSTAIQIWGRVLRSCPESGKTECLLLDFSGNIIRFADDFSDVFFNGVDQLDMGEKLDRTIRKDEDHEPKSCPKCGYTPRGGKRCVGCGYETLAQPSFIKQRPGDMKEMVLQGQRSTIDLAGIYAQVATYARQHSKPEKQNQRAAALFKDLTGRWPPRSFNVETAPHMDPTPAVLNKIRSLNIAFAHGRPAA